MTKKNMRRTLATALCLGLIADGFAADQYVPDTIEIPASAPFALSSPPLLGLTTGGTIEFWVVADWTGNPGYHPVVLSNGEGVSPAYRVSIAADRQALLVQCGTRHARFDFDFADGATHHVAILDYDDQLAAFVDGRYSGAAAMSIEAQPLSTLSVGSLDGGVSSFIGAISALRLWDVPLDPEVLVEFALKDPFDAGDLHPDIEELLAYSNFRVGELVLADNVEVSSAMLLEEESEYVE